MSTTDQGPRRTDSAPAPAVTDADRDLSGASDEAPGSADAVLAGLDPEQRAAATALDGPVCVLAGAGTGKTRAITHRIAYGVHSGVWTPQTVLAVTFTTRAAGQMRTRLAGLGVPGVQARTFHSAALRQARYFWPQVHRGELPPIIESKLGLIGEAAARCRVRADTASRRDLAGEIEWAKVSNVRPDDYVGAATQTARQVSGHDLATVAHVFAAYEEVRRERGRIDLEDVLLCAVALLADQPKVAAAVRRQYRHLVVDEYQDVSPIQQTLLDLWLGDRHDLCVVGDPNQTIYSFAGASPSYLLDFTHRHPGATVVRLVRDYRSTPQVVRVANDLSAGAGRIEPRPAERLVLRAQRDDGPEPTFIEYPDEVAEAEAVAREIVRLRDQGVPLREIACLFRVNAQSESFEQALADRGIPYLVRGAERFFGRPEVRQAAVLLRGAARVGDGTGDAGTGLTTEVRAVLGAAGWSAEPPTGAGALRERWESLAAIVGLADDLVRERPAAGLVDFVAVLDERMAAQHAPAADGVTLATLHAAKGLEWDAVFLAGIHEGTVPITYAETPRQIEEERRLLYVGITRARVHLFISWSLARTPGGRGRRAPSRFLDGVRPVEAGTVAGHRSGPGRRQRSGRGAAVCRSCSRPLRTATERKVGRCDDCPSSVDEELFDRLRGWRLDRSRSEQVPAFCVFTDATLTAIAETRPADQRSLSAIPGIGAAKLAKYGEDVIELCATGGGAADGAPPPVQPSLPGADEPQ